MKLIISTILLIASVAMYLKAAPLYGLDDDVVVLTLNNFDRLVINGTAIWVIEFYFPWCGHAQAFEPEYKKVATKLKGVVKVGAINSIEQKEIADRYGIYQSPIIKIFGADKSSPLTYSGERTVNAVVEAAHAEVNKKV